MHKRALLTVSTILVLSLGCQLLNLTSTQKQTSETPTQIQVQTPAKTPTPLPGAPFSTTDMVEIPGIAPSVGDGLITFKSGEQPNELIATMNGSIPHIDGTFCFGCFEKIVIDPNLQIPIDPFFTPKEGPGKSTSLNNMVIQAIINEPMDEFILSGSSGAELQKLEKGFLLVTGEAYYVQDALTKPEPTEPTTSQSKPTATAKPTAIPITIRLRLEDKSNDEIDIEVLEGTYKLTSGTELWAGSHIWIEKQHMTFPVGLAIEVGPAGLTLKGKSYPAGSLLYVEVEGKITEIQTDDAGFQSPSGLDTVQVATDGSFPPFEIVDDDTNEIIGFDIDVMNAIAKRGGFQVEYINVAWDELLSGMAKCKYDAAISAITITEDRLENFNFSEPYFDASPIIIVSVNNTEINSQDDLGGKIIGAQPGSAGAAEVEEIRNVELKYYDDIGLAFKDLVDDQIDSVVTDKTIAEGHVEKYPDKFKTVGQILSDYSLGIAICQDNTELLEMINQGLAAAEADGIIDQAVQDWLVTGDIPLDETSFVEPAECLTDDGSQREYLRLQSPFITNQVVIDGRISSEREWANAYCIDLRLHEGLDINSTFTRRIRWRVQNDSNNLYFLLRVAKKEMAIGIYVDYFWPRYTGTWEHSDGIFVRTDGTFQDNAMWDEQKWHQDIDLDPAGSVDAVVAVSEDAEFYWFEIQRELASGDIYDWAFDLAQKVGNNPNDSFITGIVLNQNYYNRNLQMIIGSH